MRFDSIQTIPFFFYANIILCQQTSFSFDVMGTMWFRFRISLIYAVHLFIKEVSSTFFYFNILNAKKTFKIFSFDTMIMEMFIFTIFVF